MLKRSKNIKKEPLPSPSKALVGGKTIIGEQVSVEGTIRSREDLVLQGIVKGRIELYQHHLTVGSKGRVEAEIQASSVTISGKFVGAIKAKNKVEITKQADFNGEIKAKRISVEDGAFLKAVIELERESEKEVADLSSKPAEKTAFGAGTETVIPPKEVKKEK